MRKDKVLIADDDLFIRDIVRWSLEEHFEVLEASDGEEALRIIKEKHLALAILDYKMPGKTGIEVCREIRENPFLMHLPIVILTGKSEVQDKVEGLEAGADDYIVKPFEPDELLARVKMILKRSRRDLDANPLTRLPGNVSIINEIQERLDKKEKFAVLYLDLNKFKAFNDYYGFERGDELIKETAGIILESIGEKGGFTDFVGHIGGDDFVVVTSIDRAEEVAREIIKRFEGRIPFLYDKEDRDRGYILSKDRTGEVKKFALVSISIGIVTNQLRTFRHIGEISAVGAELKNHAKTFKRSIYVKEKRKS